MCSISYVGRDRGFKIIMDKIKEENKMNTLKQYLNTQCSIALDELIDEGVIDSYPDITIQDATTIENWLTVQNTRYLVGLGDK